MKYKKANKINPRAKSESIIQSDKFRISILTSRLIRFEYSEEGIFEDRKTKGIINRNFKSPEYKVYDREDELKIVTDHVIIRYNKKKFDPYGLSVELRGKVNHPYRSIWHFGDRIPNLGGTARTLDFVEGEIDLEDGLLSRYGISVIDDSKSPILTEDGWYKSRESDSYDFYVFAYKDKYLGAINDFLDLSGRQPIIPRYALGNWWSKFSEYSKKDYLDLMDKFEEYKSPFSVMVLDMLWHIVGVDEKYGSDWTGYTWNKELLGDPEELFKEIKDKNYRLTLNLHPSAGIRAYEDFYEGMSKSLGYDYGNEETIDFSYLSRDYADSLNKHFYKPFEKMGVDFWWVDWQQSPMCVDENKDALWILNHYRYNDMASRDEKALTFSRYAGIGSQRYPIGFSGDTSINWETLNFQPYFTATSSNIGYGWWSHDIGGHMKGITDPELFVRWVQFGVFSPINRLHSSNSLFVNKEPWSFDDIYSKIMVNYLQIRHKLIPYIYSMNYKSHYENIPLIRPIYYYYPNEEGAYFNKNQYYFGDSIMVAPMTEKIDERLQMSEFKSWLPEGEYFDIQTGIKYRGGRKLNIYRPKDRMALFLKAGSILPLADLDRFYTNSIENPEYMKLIITPGKSCVFNMIEDDNKNNSEVETLIEFDNEKNQIKINQPKGNLNCIPAKRNWNIEIYGLKIDNITCLIDGESKKANEISYDLDKNTTTIILDEIDINKDLIIKLDKVSVTGQEDNKLKEILEILKRSRIETLKKEALYDILTKSKDSYRALSDLLYFDVEDKVKNAILEILMSDKIGFYQS